MDEKTARAHEAELADLQVVLSRKRAEVSNLKVGYTRAVEGTGSIPYEPLRRNLIAARAELTDIEQRLKDVQRRLDTAKEASPSV